MMDGLLGPTICWECFDRLFLSLKGISNAKNKTIHYKYLVWDQKSSLFLGSEIIEAKNQQITRWFLSPEITALPYNLSEI